ncbi:hypothetical protein O181_006947 [Austropuccinia psidii MF-1]|uniref:Uncharacterized protein n=1 Tax=Austropuccinia psidii MF-1 TaxID=1389203 RepID=A0A9Q3GI09_9BASI|nr:hypothetical protein [Austropuccinia psidii MF-1]
MFWWYLGYTIGLWYFGCHACALGLSHRLTRLQAKIPKEYYCNTHIQCQLLTAKFPASNLTPTSYPSLFSFASKQKLIQLPSRSDLPMMTLPHPMIQSHSSLIEKLEYLFSGIEKFPMDSPPVNFGPPHLPDTLLITNKVVSPFESLLTNTPLGGMLTDDMGLGKNIQVLD